jgi:hypothetical protein
VAYDHPDAARLIGEVQQEYVVRYGGSSGCTEIPAYGYYACSPHSMHFGKNLAAPTMG